MTRFSAIDLSRQSAPDVVQQVSFDAIFAEMKAKASELYPELAPYLNLESEPTTKVLRVCAYYRMLDRLEFNDGARANMLALSTGTNLDGLAAFWGVERLVVQVADDSVTPPIAQIKEADEALRRRVQLSLEAHTSAGSRGAYIYWALSASGDIKDVSAESPVAGQVLISVLTHDGSGVALNGVLNAVQTALNDEDVRPLTDQVIVQSAQIIPYEIEATLTLYEGPDAAMVEAAASNALATYIDEHHRLGHDINLSGIYAALHQPGVQNVSITNPLANIAVASHQAAFCSSDAVAITIGGRDV